MIIKLLLDLVYGVIGLLTMAIYIPQMNETVLSFVNQFKSYLSAGAGILANYTHFGYLISLIGIIVVIDISIMLYKFVMWIIKKIPMLSVN